MGKKVRAIIDASGLRIAPLHYQMFPFEPSVDAADDMEIFFDDKKDKIKSITLEAVMKRMVEVITEKVIMIVAHGFKGGFIMPVVTGSVKAAAQSLESMIFVHESHRTAERLRLLAKIFGKRDQFAGWQKLLRTLPGGENATVGPGQSPEADKIYTKWETQQLRSLKISIDKLNSLMQVRARLVDSPFDRVEIRACNMGADPKELEGLRKFLGCKRIVAPNQDTFFGTAKPELLKPTTTLIEFCKKNGGTDAFMIDGGFALKVTEPAHAKYTTKAATVSDQAVKDWVKKHVMTTSPLLVTKEFHVMALRSRLDPKNRHPFTYPLDFTYRKLLVRKG